MRRADRLFDIVQILRGRRITTAQELANRLEVSVRTVYRDIRDLQSSGVPIEGEAGVGYVLQRGYELPPLTFNSEELEALVLGVRLVSAWGDRSLAAASQRILNKVESVLPETLKGSMDSTHLFAQPYGVHPSPHLEQVRVSVAQRQKLAFGYIRGDGGQSHRVVRPLGLYFWGRTWLLAAWCELRQDFRNFRVDRMKDVEQTQEVFEDCGEISLAAYLRAMEQQEQSSC